MSILIDFALVIVSCVWIMKACDPFEDSADYLGKDMKEGTKGATINAIASSMPEFLSTVIFLFFYHDKAGFAAGIGTTAGSAVFNAMVIPAFCILAVLVFMKNSKFHLSKKAIMRDGIFLVTAEVVLIVLLAKSVLTWWHGLILLIIYAVYMLYMIQVNKSACDDDGAECIAEQEEDDDDDEINMSPWIVNLINFDYKNLLHRNQEFTKKTAIITLLIAVAHISAACYLLADSVVNIAEYYNMNTFFVAVIVAAAATSVPDTVISFKDAMKGNYDDSISNAVGSNIFDICVCLGLPLMAYSLINGPIVVPQSDGITELRIILLVLSLFVIFMLMVPKKIGYITSICFLSGYIFYASYSWCRGMGIRWANDLGDFIGHFFHII